MGVGSDAGQRSEPSKPRWDGCHPSGSDGLMVPASRDLLQGRLPAAVFAAWVASFGRQESRCPWVNPDPYRRILHNRKIVYYFERYAQKNCRIHVCSIGFVDEKGECVTLRFHDPFFGGLKSF
jgi:hypothetical protein